MVTFAKVSPSWFAIMRRVLLLDERRAEFRSLGGGWGSCGSVDTDVPATDMDNFRVRAGRCRGFVLVGRRCVGALAE